MISESERPETKHGAVSFTPDLTEEEWAAVEIQNKANNKAFRIGQRVEAKRARAEIARLDKLRLLPPARIDYELSKGNNILRAVPHHLRAIVISLILKGANAKEGRRRVTLGTVALIFGKLYREGLGRYIAETICRQFSITNGFLPQKENEFADAFNLSWEEGTTQYSPPVIDWEKKRETLRQCHDIYYEHASEVQSFIHSNSVSLNQRLITLLGSAIPTLRSVGIDTPNGVKELRAGLKLIDADNRTYVYRAYDEYLRIIETTKIRRKDQQRNFRIIVSHIMARIAYERRHGCIMADNSLNKLQELICAGEGPSQRSIPTLKCYTYTSIVSGGPSKFSTPTINRIYEIWSEQNDNMKLTRGVKNEYRRGTRIQVALLKAHDPANESAAEEWYSAYLALWDSLEDDEGRRSEENEEQRWKTKKLITEAEIIVGEQQTIMEEMDRQMLEKYFDIIPKRRAPT